MAGPKSQQLNELFETWKARFPGQERRLCPDGIICEEIFEAQSPKILFVAKEPNTSDDGFDFREWWSREVKYLFTRRISEWAYGIQHGFPPFDEIDSGNEIKIATLKTISFMNLKKTGGGSSSNMDEIRAIVGRDKDLIKAQIEIIAPNVIVGGVGDSAIWPMIFPEISLVPTGFDVKAGRHEACKIVDFYHPSYQVPRAMSYALLSRVFASEVFERL